MSSTSSLRGAHAPSTASDEDESTYIRRTRILQWVRMGLCAAMVVLAVAAVGAEGHPLRYYNKTVQYEKMYLSLWPENIEMRPTIALIACGSIIALQSLVYLIVALLPSPRSRIFILNSLVTATAIGGFIAALIAVIFTLVYTNPRTVNGTYRGETIHSWTCTWGFANGKDVNGDKIDGVVNFAQLCRETRASFTLMCILLLLQFMLCVSAGAGWFLEIEVKKKRDEGAAAAGGFQSEKGSV
ncbi:hypothetical protein PRK78_000051 [Emydomyces testavorans]|uniref:Uncharacterized protein n=1 Tax=Emydomyces testavorans TaxID=2070801 RepID=A0AAF0D9Y9_9EURO|nr:hypothetical protein PRK78_000051 [Emydomyces testavorans]